MSMRTRGADVAQTKSSPTDIVTEADRTSEELIRRRLLGARPDDGFVGEEGNDIEGSSGVSWVVDPIDGTVNYLYGLPHYAVSIAASARRRGRGRRGARPRPRGGVRRDRSVVGPPATAYPSRCGTARHSTRPWSPPGSATRSTSARARPVRWRGCSRRSANIRRQGSCALDLCAVAAGQSDGYVEEGAYAWDHAAGGLIAAEAGATFEVWTTVADRDLVVCAPAEPVGPRSRPWSGPADSSATTAAEGLGALLAQSATPGNNRGTSCVQESSAKRRQRCVESVCTIAVSGAQSAPSREL